MNDKYECPGSGGKCTTSSGSDGWCHRHRPDSLQPKVCQALRSAAGMSCTLCLRSWELSDTPGGQCFYGLRWRLIREGDSDSVVVADESTVGFLRGWWQLGAWRGSPEEARADRALAGEVLVPEWTGDGPDPELIMFNPACSHDRCCETISKCPECSAWRDAHWADRIDVGAAGGGSGSG